MMLFEQHFFDDCVDKEMFLQKGQIENPSPVKGWTNTMETTYEWFSMEIHPHLKVALKSEDTEKLGLVVYSFRQ